MIAASPLQHALDTTLDPQEHGWYIWSKSDIDIGQSFRMRARVWLGSSRAGAIAGMGLGFYIMPRSEYNDLASGSREGWQAKLAADFPVHGLAATVKTKADLTAGFSIRASTKGFGAAGCDSPNANTLGWTSGCKDTYSSATGSGDMPGKAAGEQPCSCYYYCATSGGNTCPHVPQTRAQNRGSWATFELKINQTKVTLRWDGVDVFNGATMPGHFTTGVNEDWVFLIGESI